MSGTVNGSEDDRINYRNIEDVRIVLSNGNDVVGIVGKFGYSDNLKISVNGYGGHNQLIIDYYQTDAATNFVMNAGKTVFSNLGTFRNFERISITGYGMDDMFGGGSGDDRFDGHAGSDTVTYHFATAGVTIQLRDGAVDTVGAGVDTFYSIENLIGSQFDDVLTGHAAGGPNRLEGGAGDDRLSGLGGDDMLDGGTGDDMLDGGTGDDLLMGGAGHDVLIGGRGDDVLIGGGGADRLEGGKGADTFVYTLRDLIPAADRILDFSTAEGDRIDLSGIDADAAVDGDQTFSFLGTAAFTGAGGTAGELRYEAADRGFLLVQGDVNHDGLADFTLLVRAPALAATDFVL